tara:strand:+ start:8924 stop:9205 length:282 start_codon:yes stop_codon:yes gene_type:complete
MKNIEAIWTEASKKDKKVDFTNKLARLNIEAQTVILELKGKKAEVEETLKNLAATCHGKPNAFQAILNAEAQVEEVSTRLTEAEALGKSLFTK